MHYKAQHYQVNYNIPSNSTPLEAALAASEWRAYFTCGYLVPGAAYSVQDLTVVATIGGSQTDLAIATFTKLCQTPYIWQSVTHIAG